MTTGETTGPHLRFDLGGITPSGGCHATNTTGQAIPILPPGTPVRAGQVVGNVGHTGNAQGSRIRFQHGSGL